MGKFVQLPDLPPFSIPEGSSEWKSLSTLSPDSASNRCLYVILRRREQPPVARGGPDRPDAMPTFDGLRDSVTNGLRQFDLLHTDKFRQCGFISVR